MPLPTASHSPSRIAAFLVARRGWIAAVALLLTLGMALLAPGLSIERSLNFFHDNGHKSYSDYRRFVKTFGDDGLILLAARPPGPVNSPEVLQALAEITKELAGLPGVVGVTNLANLKLPGLRNGQVGAWPLVEAKGGKAVLDIKRLDQMRSRWPVLDLLLSRDAMVTGVIIRVASGAVVGERSKKILAATRAAARRLGGEFHLAGAPVLREAFARYNQRMALVFGLLGALVGVLVQLFIFRSLRVTMLIVMVCGLAIIWVMGLMALLDVRLDAATSVSFGLVFILTVPVVIHLSSHFNRAVAALGGRRAAMERTLTLVARPSMICALTTAAGFASLMFSDLPPVRQLGLVMSLGVMLAYLLAMGLLPAISCLLPKPGPKAQQVGGGLMSRVEGFLGRLGRGRPHLWAWIGLGIMLVCLAGAPLIKSEPPLLHMFAASTPEAQAQAFVRKHLAPLERVNLVVHLKEGAWRQPEIWQRVEALEKALVELKEVEQATSALDTAQALGVAVLGGPVQPSQVPLVLDLALANPEAKPWLSRFINQPRDMLRIQVRFMPEAEASLERSIAKVKAVAQAHSAGLGRVTVTGHLALATDQAGMFVRAQVKSLLIAFGLMTILLALQFRSFLLGVLSLIPNLLPLAVIFGVMGWAGIYLDSLTILVAVISLGLSVDDTIHYLSQLRREMAQEGPGLEMKQYLAQAYRTCGRALISTSAVLFFAFLVLLPSPYLPMRYFAVLASAAVAAALAGDVIFMPAVILSSKRLQAWLRRGLG